MKKLFIIFFLVSISFIGKAQSISEFNNRIYDSYVSGRMNEWKSTISDMEQLYDKTADINLLNELMEARYGYIGFCIKEDRKKEASRQLELARANLDRLRTANPENAGYMAFEGAFLGYEMGIHKIKAMLLGPKAKELINTAVESDPTRLRTILEKANMLNFSPGIVGGDTGEAIKYYHIAIEMLEAGVEKPDKNWIYVNTIIVLAQTYEKIGNYTYACKLYEKIMSYDPDIKWVKTDLYADCLEKKGTGQ